MSEHLDREQRIAYVMAETAAFNCRVQGMWALNQHREMQGYSQACGGEEFAAVEKEFLDKFGGDIAKYLITETDPERIRNATYT